jgi:predicted O-methyltransferase YrrM
MEYFVENMMSVGVWEGISLSQGYSWELADRFSDESVDFIWIDADHHYSSVIQDIRAWWPKLKKGGIIAGHDYTDEGVKLAVREFFDEFTVHATRNECWSVKKENV